jgi:YD repeat-containing protein
MASYPHHLTSITDARGGVVTARYDSWGSRTAETNALGLPEETWTLHEYDFSGYGQVTTRTDALGNQTTYTYDVSGDLATACSGGKIVIG